MANKFEFNTYLRNTKNFITYIFGYSIVTGWFVTVNQKIQIVVGKILFIANMIVTVKIKYIRIIVSNSLVKLLSRLIVIIYIKKITLVAVMRQLLKVTNNINIIKITISNNLRQILRITGGYISIKKITLAGLPIVARFLLLSYYDPDYLNTWDNTLLRDMDYTISP